MPRAETPGRPAHGITSESATQRRLAVSARHKKRPFRARHLRGLIGGFIVLAAVLTAVFAPALAPANPDLQHIAARLLPPRTDRHILGTDEVGRDVLSRIIFGSRVSLIVGFLAVVVSGALGTVLGLVAGYYGSWVDSVIMRLLDVQMAIPSLVLAITVVAVFGPGLVKVIVILGVTGWVLYGRVVRGDVLALRQREFIEAAHALGARNGHIILHHILRNVMASVVVVATLQVGAMIITAASLSFLGLGVPVTVPTWGGMVTEGRNYLSTAWWIAFFPGLAIMATVFGVNFLGDWLRDWLDPRLQGLQV